MDPDSHPTTTVPAGGDLDEHDAVIMHLLHEHVPLSLLVDLAEPGTPDSRAICAAEGEPTEHWWEPGRR